MRIQPFLSLAALPIAALGAPIPAASPAHAQRSYVFTNLDVPGSAKDTTTASGINNPGQIVGSYHDARGDSHGFVYSNGGYKSLDIPGATDTFLTGINDSGQIVGYDLTKNTTRAFLDTGGVVKNIVDPSSSTYKPVGINNNGQILGQAGLFDYNLYYNGAFTQIYNSTDTLFYGLDNNKKFVGSFNGLSHQFGFLLQNGAMTTIISYPNSKITKGEVSQAYGINDDDKVVGYFKDPSGRSEGFIDTNGAYTVVDAPGAQTTVLDGINDAGDLIGYDVSVPGYPQAFLATASALATASPLAMDFSPATASAALGLAGLRGSRGPVASSARA